ncbi:MAG: hypothetical protein WCA46_13705 [Actinocatenispora sp.]
MKRKYLVGMVLGVLSVLSLAVPANASAGAGGFAAQAREAGYSPAQSAALQHKVDRYVALMHGRQVAINKVEFPGGDVLLPLPGEKRARELGAVTPAASYHGCAYAHMCLFPDRSYAGTKIDMVYCYEMDIPDGWRSRHGSWSNNQTAGTQGIFYHWYPGHRWGVWGLTGNPPAAQPDADWAPVASVRNCWDD